MTSAGNDVRGEIIGETQNADEGTTGVGAEGGTMMTTTWTLSTENILCCLRDYGLVEMALPWRRFKLNAMPRVLSS
jgi:hypothetical protein